MKLLYVQGASLHPYLRSIDMKSSRWLLLDFCRQMGRDRRAVLLVNVGHILSGWRTRPA
jgi:hypothetical protein